MNKVAQSHAAANESLYISQCRSNSIANTGKVPFPDAEQPPHEECTAACYVFAEPDIPGSSLLASLLSQLSVGHCTAVNGIVCITQTSDSSRGEKPKNGPSCTVQGQEKAHTSFLHIP